MQLEEKLQRDAFILKKRNLNGFMRFMPRKKLQGRKIVNIKIQFLFNYLSQSVK